MYTLLRAMMTLRTNQCAFFFFGFFFLSFYEKSTNGQLINSSWFIRKLVSWTAAKWHTQQNLLNGRKYSKMRSIRTGRWLGRAKTILSGANYHCCSHLLRVEWNVLAIHAFTSILIGFQFRIRFCTRSKRGGKLLSRYYLYYVPLRPRE